MILCFGFTANAFRNTQLNLPKGIFVTTSDFTIQARDFASQARIELVNRAKLIQLFDEYKQ
jgi:restriction endonuclease Mrr